jgi:UDP-N-acetylenolpyruvoylglucosamine reductase
MKSYQFALNWPTTSLPTSLGQIHADLLQMSITATRRDSPTLTLGGGNNILISLSDTNKVISVF